MAKSILIADDNERIRRLLTHFFKSHPIGFDVYEAHDGFEAVEKVTDIKPDLIVLDLSMPRLNGLGAARKLREMKIRAPIILFTMYAAEVPAMEISSTGITAVVLKPDLTALHQQVEFLLNQESPSLDSPR